MKVFCVAIDSVKFSSKSELSARFFGCLKFSVLFEYLGLELGPGKSHPNLPKTTKNQVTEGLGSVLGGSWGNLGACWALLETFWASWRGLGGILGATWGILGGLWSLLEIFWDHLGVSWEPLGRFFEGFWEVVEAFLGYFLAS